MPADPSFTVKITGTSELIDELKEVARQNPESVQVKSAGRAEPSSGLKLGLHDAATLVSLVNGLATLGKFAHSIYKALREKRAQRVAIQTPIKTIEIFPSDATDVEKVRSLLESAVRV